MKKIKSIRSFYPYCFALGILFLALTGCASQRTVTPRPQPTRDGSLEKKAEAQLQAINPDAVPVYQSATRVYDAGNYEAAKKLYEQVITLAPGFSTAYRRLGYIETSLKDPQRAEELTRKALALEPDGYNQSALASIIVQKNTPKDAQEAFNLASAAVKLLPDDEQANLVLLVCAGAINDIATIRRVDQHLLELDPENVLAHYFAGVVAATDGNWENADAELRYSEQLGMPSAAVDNALNQGISRNLLLTRFLRWGAVGLVLWLLGLGALFVIGTFLSRATIKALNQPQPAVNIQIKPEERRLRSIYRALINILSLYFYISIPFVILVLLLLVGGAFYIFLLIGTIPIQLSLVLLLMLLASLFAIARALFSRTKDIPPGRQLYKKDAPELWRLVENVAQKLNIRPIDAIYLTPGTDIAVNEKGGILRKLRGAGRRNLILGMGMLPALNQGQFAAILAHEYGHFSNQDTAGGDMASQVFASLQQLAQRLIQGRVAYIFNPVWLFVFTYQRIFLRVTLGASRLQEVLADRYAAIAYGSQNFIEGLQSVIRQSIAFPMQANHEVRKSMEAKQPVYNLYILQPDDTLDGELNRQLDEQMNRPTSQYDSHPAPHERIAWIERLNIPYHSIEDTSRSALELLPNPEELQRALTAEVMKNVRK